MNFLGSEVILVHHYHYSIDKYHYKINYTFFKLFPIAYCLLPFSTHEFNFA